MSRRVVITGAASGLGLALAHRFHAAGDRLLLTDLDGERLEAAVAAVGERAAGLAHDVRDDRQWAAVRAWCEERWGGVDVLVNNAGVATGGRFAHQPIEDWQWVLDIDLLGVVRGCRAFVPLMTAQGHGHLVNVASLAGLINPPANASYNAAKAGVVSLSETLRLELEPAGIRTTVVCPSFFRTGLTATFRTGDDAIRGLMGKLVDGSDVTPDAIAERVVAAVDRGRFLVLTDRDGRSSYLVKRWLPPLFRAVARKRTASLLARLEGAR
ncbi:SDR family oxidoreductase [Patulibacter defluvii]|uniref:SDR family oxidoreductase n=1 Tax=Patulibacter defluvii TaxID=3095358 RepID=UPI002A74FFE0|nr:SDR family oxidoreductase [Patulibacter sp. DM4]